MLTKQQALEYISQRLRISKGVASGRKSKLQEAQEIIDRIILSHIPLNHGSFHMPYKAKTRYMALMIRRIIDAIYDPSKLDDKDYYGNKRLELAGQLISLLFEDLFKRFQVDLKKKIEKELPKRAAKGHEFDAATCINVTTITQGLVAAMKSGNWNIKRFKMNRSSITAELTRLSYISAIGMMTRINS